MNRKYWKSNKMNGKCWKCSKDNVIKWIENDLWAIITLVHTNQVLCVREC